MREAEWVGDKRAFIVCFPLAWFSLKKTQVRLGEDFVLLCGGRGGERQSVKIRKVIGFFICASFEHQIWNLSQVRAHHGKEDGGI